MKHNTSATIFLVSFFLITQILGLFLIGLKVEVQEITDESGNIIKIPIQNDDVARPEFKQAYGGFLWISIGVIVGTILLLIIRKLKQPKIWKYWFLIAVTTSISIALSVVIPGNIALVIAIILAIMKVFHKQIIIHNLTEVLMYAGIGVLAVPLFNLLWGVILLIAISLYDMYAVWRSKHMVKMAEFMTESTFAGLVLPYTSKGNKIKGKINIKKIGKDHESEERVAILGGGDVAFPLIFAGVTLRFFIINHSLLWSFSLALIVALFSGIALSLLLIKGKPQKFYPAMPFISAGCFIGLGIAYLISQII